MLLEQVKLGDSFSADKLYIEVANGTWWTRRIELAHLDVIGARLQLAPGATLAWFTPTGVADPRSQCRATHYPQLDVRTGQRQLADQSMATITTGHMEHDCPLDHNRPGKTAELAGVGNGQSGSGRRTDRRRLESQPLAGSIAGWPPDHRIAGNRRPACCG